MNDLGKYVQQMEEWKAVLMAAVLEATYTALETDILAIGRSDRAEQTPEEKAEAAITVEEAQNELAARIKTNMHLRSRPEWRTESKAIPLDPVQFYASLADVPIIEYATEYDCERCQDKGCRHCREEDEPESELDRAERMALRADEDKLD